MTVAAAVVGCVRQGASSQAPPIIIHNVNLLDGRGGLALPNSYVRVEGERIVEVGRGRPSRARGARLTDGRGGWLLPGFVDMHAHLLIPRCADKPDGTPNFDRALSERALSQMLEFGITTIRSPANPTVAGLALRDDLNRRAVRGPMAFGSAELINDPQASEAELRRLVREALPFRPDFIKAYSALPPSSVAVVIDEAHRFGIPVIGHVQRTSWAEATSLGIDQLTHAVDWSENSLPINVRADYRQAAATAHGFGTRIRWLELFKIDDPLVDQLIAQLVRRRIGIDPTLVAYESKFSVPSSPRYRSNPNVTHIPELLADWRQCSHDPTGGWTAKDFQRWQAMWPRLLAIVRRYHERGVLLTTGTDFTNPWVIPGESLHQEFELLAEAGIPNSAILKMTGANTAEVLRSSDIGIIAPSRRADLVLLANDPVADIRNTRSIVWVMQGGQIVSRGRGRQATRHRAR